MIQSFSPLLPFRLMQTHFQKGLRSAFTLIETLVVVSIIVLILTLTAPSLFSTMKSTKLSSAGDSVLGYLSEAQQMAVTNNIPIEVRFFKYSTPLSPTPAFRSLQMFKIRTGNEVGGTFVEGQSSGGGAFQEKEEAVGQLLKVPEGIIIVHDSTDLTPIFGANDFPDQKTGGGSYSGQQNATYNALRFFPDSSCRVLTATADAGLVLTYPALPQSCLTLAADNGQQITVDNLPKNFYTIQVDPYTGKLRTYRPGQY
ncbi:MAG: Verru_Chthon cassette protein D [Verrucomicrobiaceae bacterium]|nr:Verru_Chthon cassette protein D [Verrucomicrobiaceae bacterium]